MARLERMTKATINQRPTFNLTKTLLVVVDEIDNWIALGELPLLAKTGGQASLYEAGLTTSPAACTGASSITTDSLGESRKRYHSCSVLTAQPSVAWQEAAGAIAKASRELHLGATTEQEATGQGA